jgi:hypothetical protein
MMLADGGQVCGSSVHHHPLDVPDHFPVSTQVWSSYSVLNVLYSLIQKSKINEYMIAAQAGKSAEEIACVIHFRFQFMDSHCLPRLP